MARPRRAAPAGTPLSLATLGAAGDYGALAHYADPAYYRKAYGARKHDVDYYVRLARGVAGPVLEYGVGEGRVALPVARAGREVVGVDLSQPMLDALTARLAREPRQVRARVTSQRGDVRTTRLERRFPLVFAPFNLILHLYTFEELGAFLQRVREHLEPDGRFVLDVSVPMPDDLCRDPTRAYTAPAFVDPSSGKRVRYAERFEYDRVRQLLLVWMQFTPEDGSEPWVVPLTHRQWFPEELRALLTLHGFRDLRMTADFSDEPPDQTVDSLVISASA